MSHDNITDTYTYLRLCSAQHKRKKRRVGRFNLWKQVQKTELSVDFTNDGA
jgi:hypothetical protein